MDEIFRRFEQREDFEGWGYIGLRRSLADGYRQAADAMLQERVALRAMSEEALFRWANSRQGRGYADEWSDGNRRGQAVRYLP